MPFPWVVGVGHLPRNVSMLSEFCLGSSFKVKLGCPNLKVPVFCLLLVLEVLRNERTNSCHSDSVLK